jgi:uncharacterized protein (TIGR00299 family) protein
MSTVLYLDLFSGAGGDMLLSALLELGYGLEELKADLAPLGLAGLEVSVQKVTSHGLSGTRLTTHADPQSQPARNLPVIRALLRSSGLPQPVREPALRVFERLGRAEAGVHGVSVEEIHFHELGAADTLVDIVGFLAGLQRLGVRKVFCSEVPVGSGTVRTEHGLLPVPAPATAALLAEAKAPLRPHPAREEILTPTAAALLAELADFSFPAMRLLRVGHGVGAREFEWPNLVRAWLGEMSEPAAAGRPPAVVQLECNLDNATGETLGFAAERLLAAGALDVWLAPIQMKKGRPGVTLAALVEAPEVPRFAELLLRETPTLGVRWSPPLSRLTAERRSRQVATPWGTMRVKEKWLDGRAVSFAPEYEDCARIAREHGLPLSLVQEQARRAADPLAGDPRAE